MAKKLNKLTELKKEVAAFKQVQKDLVRERDADRAILNRIQEVLNPSNSSYSNRIPFGEIPVKVMELLLWRKSYEGAIRPEREQIEAQREIIRWLVNPKTAENARELEELKKMRGY